MSCCHPYKAFATGYLTDNGKVDYLIDFTGTTDLFPLDKATKPVDLAKASYTMKAGHLFLTDPVSVPCGVCVGCRMEKARQWKIRNCLELPYHEKAWFVTLTYSDDALPLNAYGQPVLVKRDLQLFFKRLRKRGLRFRYFGCGEYGSKTQRPHYHLILYGAPMDCRLVAPKQYESKILDACWDKGFVVVENVDPGSIAYVCGYVEKKQADPHWCDYPVKPFLIMSRKPGIGMWYFVENYETIKRSGKVYGVFGAGSQNLNSPIPKSFKRYLDGVEWYEKLKAAAMLAGERMEDTMRVVYGIANTEELHFAQEAGLYQRLETKRKAQL